jgi:ABC-2 type transport system permease protein
MKIQKYGWVSMLAYRLQVIMWIVTSSFSTIMSYAVVTVIYNVSSGIPGWSYFQLLALSATANLMYGVSFYLVNPYNTAKSLRTGGIDVYITKPYNPVLSMLARSGNLSNIGNVAGGVILLAYAMMNLSPSTAAVAAFAAIFILGLAVAPLFVLFFTILMYVIFKSGNFINWFMTNVRTAVSYPIGVYGIIGTLIFTVLLPFGLATFYPSSALLARISYISVLAVAAFEVALIVMFYKGSLWLIKNHYQSGGG